MRKCEDLFCGNGLIFNFGLRFVNEIRAIYKSLINIKGLFRLVSWKVFFIFMGKHYQKDVFKPILFCNGKFEISREGVLRSVYSISRYGKHTLTGNIVKTFPDSNGYKRKLFEWYENGVRKRKRVFVHRLVAEAFIPKIEGKTHINHKDCDKLNNHVSNLEWCTAAENNKHAKENDLFIKIPSETRQYIKDNYNGYNKRKLAKMFNLTPSSVYVIGTNRDGRGGEIKLFDRVVTIPVPKSKVVVDINTGEKLTAKEVSKRIGKSIKETYKILGGYEGKANNTPYRYGEGYISKYA